LLILLLAEEMKITKVAFSVMLWVPRCYHISNEHCRLVDIVVGGGNEIYEGGLQCNDVSTTLLPRK
jgi:hypothetical protein